MLQRVTDYFSAMSEGEQKAAVNYLDPMGLAPLLTLTAKHRVARENHCEVWG